MKGTAAKRSEIRQKTRSHLLPHTGGLHDRTGLRQRNSPAPGVFPRNQNMPSVFWNSREKTAPGLKTRWDEVDRYEVQDWGEWSRAPSSFICFLSLCERRKGEQRGVGGDAVVGCVGRHPARQDQPYTVKYNILQHYKRSTNTKYYQEDYSLARQITRQRHT